MKLYGRWPLSVGETTPQRKSAEVFRFSGLPDPIQKRLFSLSWFQPGWLLPVYDYEYKTRFL